LFSGDLTPISLTRMSCRGLPECDCKRSGDRAAQEPLPRSHGYRQFMSVNVLFKQSDSW